jgi:hypothetical protein
MSNKASLILTIVAAGTAALAVITTAIIVITADNGSYSGNPGDSGLSGARTSAYNPSDALRHEMQQAAERLVRESAEVFRLFNTTQFDRDVHFEPTPYGGNPLDGFLTLREGVLEFDTFDELLALVNATFTEMGAEQIMSGDIRTGGNGPVFAEPQTHPGRIGVNLHFEPISEDVLWEEINIELVFDSESVVTLFVSPVTGEGEENGEKFAVGMVKENGGWRLSGLVQMHDVFFEQSVS